METKIYLPAAWRGARADRQNKITTIYPFPNLRSKSSSLTVLKDELHRMTRCDIGLDSRHMKCGVHSNEMGQLKTDDHRFNTLETGG